MRRLLLVLAATAVLVPPLLAQTQKDISIPEFHQTLVDLGSYLDAHKGTNLASQMQAIPDEILVKLYPAVKDPRKLQRAVTALRQHDAEKRGTRQSNPTSPLIKPLDAYNNDPSCSNQIISDPPGACNPAYPDPNNSAWETMVSPLIVFGAFTANDYPDVSEQGCDLTTEVNLEQVQAGLNGAVDVGQFICAALVPPDPLAIACYVALAVIGTVGETDAGLYTDCIEQDGLVNAAKIDAGYQNTVTIYNALGAATTEINNIITDISNSVTTLSTDISNSTTTVANDLNTQTTTLSTDITNATSTIGGDIGGSTTTITNAITASTNTLANDINASTTTLALDLTNVDADIDTRIGNLSTLVTTDYNSLTNQITALAGQLTQGTALLDALLRQIMKLQLEPEGTQKILPAILTCTGTNCPNVLNKCPAAGCYWNNVGPVP